MADHQDISESLLDLTRKEAAWRDRVSRSEALLQDRRKQHEEASNKAMELFGTKDPGELRAIAKQREQDLHSMITMYDKSITVLDAVLASLSAGKKIPPGVLEALQSLHAESVHNGAEEREVKDDMAESMSVEPQELQGGVDSKQSSRLDDEALEVAQSVSDAVNNEAESTATPLTVDADSTLMAPSSLRQQRPQRLMHTNNVSDISDRPLVSNSDAPNQSQTVNRRKMKI